MRPYLSESAAKWRWINRFGEWKRCRRAARAAEKAKLMKIPMEEW
jgi:hypothetical protein